MCLLPDSGFIGPIIEHLSASQFHADALLTWRVFSTSHCNTYMLATMHVGFVFVSDKLKNVCLLIVSN